VKTLIIDNFLKSPNRIRNLALSLDYRKRNIKENFEGVRSLSIEDIDKKLYNKICNKIILEYYNKKSKSFVAYLQFHKTQETDKQDPQFMYDRVHQDDGAIIAGMIYLTPDAPINCGTQTYQEIIKNKQYKPDIIMGNIYNRLVLYPAEYFHSAVNYFGNNKLNRLVMLFFLMEIKF